MRPSSVRPRRALLQHPELRVRHFGVGEAVLDRAGELLGEAGAHLGEVLRREDRVAADRAVGVERARLEERPGAVREAVLLAQPRRDARGRRVAQDEARHQHRRIVGRRVVHRNALGADDDRVGLVRGLDPDRRGVVRTEGIGHARIRLRALPARRTAARRARASRPGRSRRRWRSPHCRRRRTRGGSASRRRRVTAALLAMLSSRVGV